MNLQSLIILKLQYFASLNQFILSAKIETVDQLNSHWWNDMEAGKLCLKPANSIIPSVLRHGKDQHSLCKYRELLYTNTCTLLDI